MVSHMMSWIHPALSAPVGKQVATGTLLNAFLRLSQRNTDLECPGESPPPSESSEQEGEQSVGCSEASESECSTQADSEESGPESLSSLPSPAPLARVPVVFMFDWDDTLLPTSAIRAHAHTIPQLRALAPLVEQILRAAKAMGHVSIVTLSKRPWVSTSAETFLPGLDMPALLHELDITVYYAQEEGIHIAGAIESRNWMQLKRNSMARCLDDCRALGIFADLESSGEQPSVISIGDSQIEMEALQGLIPASAGVLPVLPLCKTVKLMDTPTQYNLVHQCKQLISLLQSVVFAKNDVDLRISHPSEIARKVDSIAL